MLRARSESFTESDASYASSSSEVSSSAETETSSESTTTETNGKAITAAPSKPTITPQVKAPPRRIIIKYSANIEQPKYKPPIAIIGPRDSESSDAGIKSDYSEVDENNFNDDDEDEESDDEEDDDDEPTKDDLTAADATPKLTTVSDDDTEFDDDDDDDSEATSEEEEETDESSGDNHTTINGHITNSAAQSSQKGYNLDDFQLLKTIGKFITKPS